MQGIIGNPSGSTLIAKETTINEMVARLNRLREDLDATTLNLGNNADRIFGQPPAPIAEDNEYPSGYGSIGKLDSAISELGRAISHAAKTAARFNEL